jgi:hypothetical protein
MRGLRRLLQALLSGLVHGIEKREVLLLLLKLTVLLLLLLNMMMTNPPSLLQMRAKLRHCPSKLAHVDLKQTTASLNIVGNSTCQQPAD